MYLKLRVTKFFEEWAPWRLGYWSQNYLLSINLEIFLLTPVDLKSSDISPTGRAKNCWYDRWRFWNSFESLILVPPGMPKTVVTKVCTLVQSLCIRTTLWNMETTSKLWDLNCEVESPEKVGFLYYPGAPNYSWRGKGRRSAQKQIYLI